MQDLIKEIYDLNFKNSQIITFDKFQSLVSDYLNKTPDLDEETAAMIIAKKYSALEYIECKIADLPKYNQKKVKVKCQVIKISEAQTHEASNQNFKTVTVTDTKTVLALYFWREQMDELENLQEGDNVEIKGYVTINANKRPIIKVSNIELLDDIDIIIKSKTLSDLKNSDILCKATLRVSGYIAEKKRENLTLYSYLVNDESSHGILKSWVALPLEVNKVYDFYNLTREAISNDTKYSLKYSALSNIKEAKIEILDLRHTFNESVKDVTEGLMYNLKLTVNSKTVLNYNSSDGKTNTAMTYTCKDVDGSDCKFVDWANKTNIEINKEAYFRNVYVTKYNSIYELGSNIFTSINGS